MEKRVRLTARRRSASDDIPYPGTVNQEDRKFVERDKYDTFEQTINHELPDMRTEWRNDARDEIGFPIAEDHTEITGTKDGGMTVASVRQAASKAVKLSMLLLGNKVPEKMIEGQAKDFMLLGSAGLDRALSRFAKTETLYARKAEDEEEDEEETVEAKKSADEAPAEEKKEETTAKKSADETPAEEKKEETTAKKGSDEEETTAEEEAPKAKKGADEAPAAEEKKEEAPKAKKGADEEETKADDEAPAEETKAKKGAEEDEEETVEAKKGADEEDDESKVAELDIELSAAEEEDTEEDEKSASILSSLYEEVKKQEAARRGKTSEDDTEEEVVESKKSASVKARGAQKLGGQPRIASDMSVKDISEIWGDVPDVSGVFN